MFPRLLNLLKPDIPALISSISFLIASGMFVLGMPVFDFLSMALENARPSEPRTMTMRPTVHAAWFAITCASQKPTISISALHTSATSGMTSANSEKTEARGELSRRAALALRFPSFLVSHLNIVRGQGSVVGV